MNRTEEYEAEFTELDHLTDDEMTIAFAKSRSPQEFLQLLAAATEVDDEAQIRARAVRHRLNLLIKTGLERPDVNNRRMAETTGIKERDLYKRPRRL